MKTIVDEFVRDVKKTARANGIKYTAPLTKTVNIGDNVRVSGYFDPEGMELAFARKHQMWLGVLVHESCHMDQFLENCPIWKEACDNSVIWEWLEGARFSKKRVIESINLSRELELDCEKRSVRKIKEWGLPIDIKTYTRKANSYVLFYNWLKRTRKWCKPNNTPYSNSEVWMAAPAYWLNDYSEIPKKLEKMFEKHSI